MPNRFEQVDEARPGAITVSLWSDDGEAFGNIDVAPRAEGGAIVGLVQTDPRTPAMKALAGAIDLANKRGMEIVIIDPEGLWQPQWGEVYRA